MRLRPAAPADVDAVAALEQELFGTDAWSATLVRHELTAEGRCAVVAVEGHAVVGYALTRRSADVVDLDRIGVRADRRRRGVARLLLEEALTGARTDGAAEVLLEVSARNEAALAFYAASGFTGIARRRRYYRDGSDAVVMRRPLGPDGPEARG